MARIETDSLTDGQDDVFQSLRLKLICRNVAAAWTLFTKFMLLIMYLELIKLFQLLQKFRDLFVNLLPPQGFGPEAKTRGGIIVSPAYTYKECVNIGVVCL